MLVGELILAAFIIQGIGYALVFRDGYRGIRQEPTKFSKVFDAVPLGNAFLSLMLLGAAGSLLTLSQYDQPCAGPTSNIFPMSLSSGTDYQNTNGLLTIYGQDMNTKLQIFEGNSTDNMVLVGYENFVISGLVGGFLNVNSTMTVQVPDNFYYNAIYSAASFNGVYDLGC